MVAILEVWQVPSITIKGIPEDLLERLRRRAAEDKRSMNREVLHLLTLALSGEPAPSDAARMAWRIDAQLRAWRQLAGRWQSGGDAVEAEQQV